MPPRPKPEEVYFVGRCFAGIATFFTFVGGAFGAENLLVIAGGAAFLSVVTPRESPKAILVLLSLAGIAYIGALGWHSISYYLRPQVDGSYNAWPVHLVFCLSVAIVVVELLQTIREIDGKGKPK